MREITADTPTHFFECAKMYGFEIPTRLEKEVVALGQSVLVTCELPPELKGKISVSGDWDVWIDAAVETPVEIRFQRRHSGELLGKDVLAKIDVDTPMDPALRKEGIFTLRLRGKSGECFDFRLRGRTKKGTEK